MSYPISNLTVKIWLETLSEEEKTWRQKKRRWWSSYTQEMNLIQWRLEGVNRQIRHKALTQVYQAHQSLPWYRRWWHWCFNIDDIRWKYQWLKYEEYHATIKNLQKSTKSIKEISQCFHQMPSALRASCALLHKSIESTLSYPPPSSSLWEHSMNRYDPLIIIENKNQLAAESNYRDVCQFLGLPRINTLDELAAEWQAVETRYRLICFTIQLLKKETDSKPIEDEITPFFQLYQKKIKELIRSFPYIDEACRRRVTEIIMPESCTQIVLKDNSKKQFNKNTIYIFEESNGVLLAGWMSRSQFKSHELKPSILNTLEPAFIADLKKGISPKHPHFFKIALLCDYPRKLNTAGTQWNEGIQALDDILTKTLLSYPEKKLNAHVDISLVDIITLAGFYDVPLSRLTSENWQALLSQNSQQLKEDICYFYNKHADTEGFVDIQEALKAMIEKCIAHEQTLQRCKASIVSTSSFDPTKLAAYYQEGQALRRSQWNTRCKKIDQDNQSPLTATNQYYFDLFKAAAFLGEEYSEVEWSLAKLQQRQIDLELDYAGNKKATSFLTANRTLLTHLAGQTSPKTVCRLSRYWRELAQLEGQEMRQNLQIFSKKSLFAPLNTGLLSPPSSLPPTLSASEHEHFFVHMVEKFAEFEFQGCDFLQLQTLPTEEEIEKLPGNRHALAAYALVGEQTFYYIDKQKKVCVLIEITPAQLSQLLITLSVEKHIQQTPLKNTCLIQSLTHREIMIIETAIGGRTYFDSRLIFDYEVFLNHELSPEDIQKKLNQKIKQCKLLAAHPDKIASQSENKDLLILTETLCTKLDNDNKELPRDEKSQSIWIAPKELMHTADPLLLIALERARIKGRYSINTRIREIDQLINKSTGEYEEKKREGRIDHKLRKLVTISKETFQASRDNKAMVEDNTHLIQLNDAIAEGQKLKKAIEITFNPISSKEKLLEPLFRLTEVAIARPKNATTFDFETAKWKRNSSAATAILLIFNPGKKCWVACLRNESIYQDIPLNSVFTQALDRLSQQPTNPSMWTHLKRLLQQYTLFQNLTPFIAGELQQITATMQEAYTLQQVYYKQMVDQWLTEYNILEQLWPSQTLAMQEQLLQKIDRMIARAQILLQTSHYLLEDYPSLEAGARLGEKKAVEKTAHDIQTKAKAVAEAVPLLRDKQLQFLRGNEISLIAEVDNLHNMCQTEKEETLYTNTHFQINQINQILEKQNMYMHAKNQLKNLEKILFKLETLAKSLGVHPLIEERTKARISQLSETLRVINIKLEKKALCINISISELKPQDYPIIFEFLKKNVAPDTFLSEWMEIFVPSPNTTILEENINEKLVQLKKYNITIPPQPLPVPPELCKIFPTKLSISNPMEITDEKERNEALKLAIDHYIQFTTGKKQALKTYQAWIKQIDALLLTLETKQPIHTTRDISPPKLEQTNFSEITDTKLSSASSNPSSLFNSDTSRPKSSLPQPPSTTPKCP